MSGYVQLPPRAFAGLPRQAESSPSGPSAIERLAFELFGDLDGDDGSEGPHQTQSPPRRTPAATAGSGSPSAPFSSPAFNSFTALAAYDASLRRAERTPMEPRPPAEPGDLQRGRLVYARVTEGETEAGAPEPGGSGSLRVDYRF